MSLNANMDLVSEKIELDAFLSRCLELKPTGSETANPETEQKLDASADLMDYARQSDEEREKPVTPEPMERADAGPLTPAAVDEIAEAGPAVMETPPVQAGAEDLKMESPAEPLPEARTEDRTEDQPEIHPDVPFNDHMPQTGAPEPAEDARQKEFDIMIERETGPVPQVDIVIPRTHFGPEDQLNDKEAKTSKREIIVDESCAEPPKTRAEEKRDADESRLKTENSAAVQDRSSLRKPSRNAAAMAYARKKESRKKTLLVILYVIIAIVLGIEAFLYIFPDAGYRITDLIGRQTNIISGQEATKANPADTRKEVRQTVQQRITRDGK